MHYIALNEYKKIKLWAFTSSHTHTHARTAVTVKHRQHSHKQYILCGWSTVKAPYVVTMAATMVSKNVEIKNDVLNFNCR